MMKSFVTTLNEYLLPMYKLDPMQYRFNFVDPTPENLEDKRAEIESGIKNTYNDCKPGKSKPTAH